MRLETMLMMILASAPLLAQDAPEAPTPRQAYQRAEVLFAQGHTFTADEETGLNDLRAQLVDSGDADLAASLDLLRLGASSFAEVVEARTKAQSSLDLDTQLWTERERFLQDRGFWRGVRDGGLVLFTASTATTLLLAFTNDRNDGYLKSGFFTDWQSRNSFASAMNWALAGSVSTMFVSLFPLLWGESRQ